MISLVPWTFHPKIARACIANKTNFVSTSYVSDAMAAMDEDAKVTAVSPTAAHCPHHFDTAPVALIRFALSQAAGITLLNEIGVDPGMDHLSAMKIIDDVKQRPHFISCHVPTALQRASDTPRISRNTHPLSISSAPQSSLPSLGSAHTSAFKHNLITFHRWWENSIFCIILWWASCGREFLRSAAI